MAANNATPQKKGAPSWVITFADLSTLMLTFFVLLISFANNDIVKFREMLGSIRDAFGAMVSLEGEFSPILLLPDSDRKSEKEETKEKQKQETGEGVLNLDTEGQEFLEVTNLLQDVKTVQGKEGIRVRIQGKAVFQPGTSVLLPESYPFLQEVAAILKKKPYLTLTVEGHTDDEPISTPAFPSNWELSGIRATTVLRFLALKGVEEERMRAVGYADTHPLTENTSPEGRSENRRVELLFQKTIAPKTDPP
jgi:chemotaxis protein MotB